MGARSLRPRALGSRSSAPATSARGARFESGDPGHRVAGRRRMHGDPRPRQGLPGAPIPRGRRRAEPTTPRAAPIRTPAAATNEPDGTGADAEPGVDASPHRDAGLTAG